MSNDDEYKKLRAAAVLLLSSINESSFSFPDSKDKLFTSSHEFWPLNACVDKFNGSDVYASGYLDAARVLARLVIFSRSKMDSLVYPIVFLYRHYLELTLKSLIRKGLRITNSHIDEKLEGVLEGHDLARLWTVFKLSLKRCLDTMKILVMFEEGWSHT